MVFWLIRLIILLQTKWCSSKFRGWQGALNMVRYGAHHTSNFQQFSPPKSLCIINVSRKLMFFAAMEYEPMAKGRRNHRTIT